MCLSGYCASARDHVRSPASLPPSLPRPPARPHWRSVAVANVLIISNTDYLKGLLLLQPLDLFWLNYLWSGAACKYYCCWIMKDYTVNIQPCIFIYVDS